MKMLNELSTIGLYYWKENLVLLHGIDTLDGMTEEILEQNQLLIEYCSLRLESYEFLYKAIDENTDAYDQQIESKNERIMEIIDAIQANDH